MWGKKPLTNKILLFTFSFIKIDSNIASVVWENTEVGENFLCCLASGVFNGILEARFPSNILWYVVCLDSLIMAFVVGHDIRGYKINIAAEMSALRSPQSSGY